MSERPDNQPFENWCCTTTDDTITLFNGKPVLLLTVLLYRVCNDDHIKFKIVIDALQDAFEAGQKCGLESLQQEQN